MRIGQNPNRGTSTSDFTDVVLTCVTHLPNLKGYHARRFEVVQTCLETMRRNAGGKYTVIIWDNDSCDEFRQWVSNIYQPDVFIQSVNIGKNLARYTLARMQDPGKVFCFSDDDILFYPNWLNPQLDLLRTYPNVACVTGYPVRTSFRWGNTNTKEWGAKYGKMQMGKFIPESWERDFCESIGRDPDWHIKNTQEDYDFLLEYEGRKAFATSHHCQFIGYSDIIGMMRETDRLAMGDERPFDEALDSVGLRLATTERLTRHMGNVIDDKLRAEVNRCLSTQVRGI